MREKRFMRIQMYRGSRKAEHLGPDRKGGHTLSKYGNDKSNTKSYTFNSAGFRSEELNPNATFKLFVCGCSYTFGTGLNVEESWPFLFKQHLAEYRDISLASINLLNFSQGGASNDYIVRTLIEQISYTQIQPDLIIVGFTSLNRFEFFDEIDNIVYQFLPQIIEKKKSRERAEKMRRAAELYLAGTNENYEIIRFAKNVLLLQSYCKNKRIPMIFLFFPLKESESSFLSKISTPYTASILGEIEMQYCVPLSNKMFVDKAADNAHPGSKSQVLIAKSVWETFLVLSQKV